MSPATYKTMAFGVSSAFAGVAGALLAIEVSYVNPDTFPLSLSILLLASVVVGGLGALSGVIFGALLLEFLPIYAQDPPLLPVRVCEAVPDRRLRRDPDPDHGAHARRRRRIAPAPDPPTFTSALAKRENVPSPMPAVPARREET